MKTMFHTFSHRNLYKDLMQVKEAEAKFAKDLSNAAAVEHVEKEEEMEENRNNKEDRNGEKGEDTVYAKKNDATLRAISVEDHYKSMDRDIKTIERLIKEADQADRSEGHPLERTFNDEDASDLARCLKRVYLQLLTNLNSAKSRLRRRNTPSRRHLRPSIRQKPYRNRLNGSDVLPK